MESSQQAASPVPTPTSDQDVSKARSGMPALVLGTLGVVFGDIGTSPIYAFREALSAATASGPTTREAVVGLLSLIIWALTLIVTVKYVAFVLKADNKGHADGASA